MQRKCLSTAAYAVGFQHNYSSPLNLGSKGSGHTAAAAEGSGRCPGVWVGRLTPAQSSGVGGVRGTHYGDAVFTLATVASAC